MSVKVQSIATDSARNAMGSSFQGATEALLVHHRKGILIAQDLRLLMTGAGRGRHYIWHGHVREENKQV